MAALVDLCADDEVAACASESVLPAVLVVLVDADALDADVSVADFVVTDSAVVACVQN